MDYEPWEAASSGDHEHELYQMLGTKWTAQCLQPVFSFGPNISVDPVNPVVSFGIISEGVRICKDAILPPSWDAELGTCVTCRRKSCPRDTCRVNWLETRTWAPLCH